MISCHDDVREHLVLIFARCGRDILRLARSRGWRTCSLRSSPIELGNSSSSTATWGRASALIWLILTAVTRELCPFVLEHLLPLCLHLLVLPTRLTKEERRYARSAWRSTWSSLTTLTGLSEAGVHAALGWAWIMAPISRQAFTHRTRELAGTSISLILRPSR